MVNDSRLKIHIFAYIRLNERETLNSTTKCGPLFLSLPYFLAALSLAFQTEFSQFREETDPTGSRTWQQGLGHTKYHCRISTRAEEMYLAHMTILDEVEVKRYLHPMFLEASFDNTIFVWENMERRPQSQASLMFSLVSDEILARISERSSAESSIKSLAY